MTEPRARRLCWILRSGSIATLLAASVPVAAAVNRWSSGGPDGGDVLAVAIDPWAPEIVYAATADRLFRSTDAAGEWQDTGLEVRRSLDIKVVVSAAQPSVIFVATSRGLLRSTDGGAGWVEVLAGAMKAVATHSSDPGLVFAASQESLWRSEDGGESWRTITPSGTPEPAAFAALELAASDGTLYAGGGAGIFRSTDRGDSWVARNEGRAPLEVTALAVDPVDAEVVYTLAAGYEVFRSIDGGASWEPTGGLPSEALSLTADPTLRDLIYVGTAFDGSFRSEDGGTSWQRPGDRFHGTIRGLVADPRDPAVLLAGVIDGGILRSEDGGASWQQRSRGLPRPEVREVLVDTGSAGLLYAVTGDGLYRSTNGGDSWAPFGPDPSPVFGDFRSMTVDPNDPSRLFAAHSPGTLYRSEDAGASWERRPFFLGEWLAALPGEPLRLLAASRFGLQVSDDSGDSWRGTSVEAASSFSLSRVALSSASPSTLYVGDANVFRSTDRGATWQIVSRLPGAGRIALGVDPADADWILAGTPGGLLRSVDGGVSWTDVGLGLPGGATPVFDPTRPERVLAATGSGVFRSIDGGETFAPLADGLDGVALRSVVLDPDEPARLYAAGMDGVYSFQQAEVLELHGGRFLAEVDWTTDSGIRGAGNVAVLATTAGAAVPLRSTDAAVIEFFGQSNWELLVKVIDGREFNAHFWVFLAAASDVGYGVTVTDTACDQVRSYLGTLGRFEPATTDSLAFGGCDEPAPASCEEAADVLCLGPEGRFRVEARWEDFAGGRGVGRQVLVDRAGVAQSRVSGLLTFFAADNWELMVKVIDGCAFNGHWWVFSAATTDVGFELEVIDTAAMTGAVRRYGNSPGVPAAPFGDTRAFPCYPGLEAAGGWPAARPTR